MSEFPSPDPKSHENPGIDLSGLAIPADAQREFAELDIQNRKTRVAELESRFKELAEQVEDLKHRLAYASESYEVSHIEETIKDLKAQMRGIRAEVQAHKELSSSDELAEPGETSGDAVDDLMNRLPGNGEDEN